MWPEGARNDPFKRSDILSYNTSILELAEKFNTVRWLPTVEQRKEGFEKLRTTRIPAHYKNHEKAVQGPFYFGDKVFQCPWRDVMIEVRMLADHSPGFTTSFRIL